MTDVTEYTVRVPYEWSDCCYWGDDETDVTVLAKSPEQARELAKNAVAGVKAVSKVHSAEILQP